MKLRIVHVAAAPEFHRLIMAGDYRRLADRSEADLVATAGADLAWLEAEGYRVHRVNIPRKPAPWADLKAVWTLWRLLRRERPDVLCSYTPKAGLVGQLSGWLAQVPCRVHGTHGLLYHGALPRWKRWLYRTVDRLTAALAHRVTYVSRSDLEFATSTGLCSRSKARYVGGGIDLGRFDPAKVDQSEVAALRRRLGIPDGAPVALTVGRFVVDKGYRELSEAAARLRGELPALRWVWVAPVLGGEEDVLPPRFVEDAGVADVVSRTQLEADLVPYYGLATILVHPSYREGAPRVLMEGAAMSLPIVATDIPGCREVVREGETAVLVPPRDGGALAMAIASLLRDPARARRIGAAARADVRARFDGVEATNRLWSVIDEGVRAARLRGPRCKRAMDLIVASVALLAALPLMAVAAILVGATMGRPVLFSQRRPGLQGVPFEVLKFRTMSEPAGRTASPRDDAARLTTVGRLLRATSVDELPQLLNVVRGEMSLVGPRPLLPEYLERYSPQQARRHEVRPGITGWAQVNGRNAITWEQKLAYDVWYVDHQSCRLDLRILGLTVLRVLSGRGISQPGRATVDEFGGPDG